MVEALLYTLAVILVIAGVGYFLSAPKYRGPVSDHFDGKKFINPGKLKAKGLPSVFKWLFTRQAAKWAYVDAPVGDKPPGRISNGLRITFINHSTFLIQVDGLNILTDPIWGERASPFSWAGPKRKRPPGIRFDDLPHIDCVLLSHNHYDHLHVSTLKRVYEKFHPKIFTVLGVTAFLEKKKIHGATEMDWWHEHQLDNHLSLVCLPAQHFSGRGMFDRDATLWSGFAIKRDGGNIYFVADTGYNNSTFKEIGERLAPIRVAIVPIGAYKPRWFMLPIHTSPEDAVKLHLDLKTQKSIASHFGTFPLGDDGPEEDLRELNEAIRKFNLGGEEFMVMKEGIGRDF